jgi:hypothetical protein
MDGSCVAPVLPVQPPNSSRRYIPRSDQLVGTLARLLIGVVSWYAFAGPMRGPPRVRSSLCDPTISVPPSDSRRKLCGVADAFSETRK